MIKYFLIRALCLAVFIASSFGKVQADQNKAYAIIDYANFINVTNAREKEAAIQLRQEYGHNTFVAYFLVKGRRNLLPILESLKKSGTHIGIISSGYEFIDLAAGAIFAMGGLSIDDADNLGTRDEVATQPIAADYAAKLTTYDHIDLYAAENSESIIRALQNRIPTLTVVSGLSIEQLEYVADTVDNK